MSNSVRPHRWQPNRLPHPWDSPGKDTGVGFHLLLQCMKVKNESEVAQSCPTLRDPMDCSPPGSSVHGILQARVLEWGAIAFSGVISIIPLIISLSHHNILTSELNYKDKYHFLLQCRKVKSESEVSQLCPTLSDPMDCSPPGSSVHGIFQARVLEWGAITFSDNHTKFNTKFLEMKG